MRVGLFMIVLGTQNVSAVEPNWPVSSSEELACKASPIEAEAPAEILEHKIEIRDSGFNSRETIEYRRCKIYNPAKAEDLTRLTFVTYDLRDMQLYMRLTLPDGATKDFSDDDLKEHALVKTSSSLTLKQKFFAVPGVVPGSIVEYKTITRQATGQADSIINYYHLQENGVPVRHYDWFCHYRSSDDYFFQYFIYSAPSAVVKQDEKARTLHVTASNLPSIRPEPLLGPFTDYIATLCTAYDSPHANLHKTINSRAPNFHMAPDNTPWGSIATGFYALEYIHTEETQRVAKLAASICEGASSDLEKAKRIHKKVQELYIKFLQRPRPKSSDLLAILMKGGALLAANPDDTLDFEREGGPLISSIDFFWLAVTLYRSAGLETRTVLLPNRLLARFDSKKVAPMFLRQICAAVRIEGKWQFSYPLPAGNQSIYLDYFATLAYNGAKSRVLLPFGVLPLYQEGQVGLFVQPNKEEFIPVPYTPADKNLLANVGSFKLDAEGRLSGQAMRRLTGHKASFLRAELINEKPERRAEIVNRQLKNAYKESEITIEKIAGIEDPDLPLEITYNIDWPGYATFTKDRLIIKPEVFRSAVDSPFTSDKRNYPINFHELWQEIDRVVIQIPPEYKPETLSSPASQPGKPLHFRIKYAYDASKHMFGVNREFSSEAVEFPVESYAQVKSWYDNMVASDHQEMVFIREDAGTPASAALLSVDRSAQASTDNH